MSSWNLNSEEMVVTLSGKKKEISAFFLLSFFLSVYPFSRDNSPRKLVHTTSWMQLLPRSLSFVRFIRPALIFRLWKSVKRGCSKKKYSLSSSSSFFPSFFLCYFPTEHFPAFEPQNSSIDLSKLHKKRLQAPKWWTCSFECCRRLRIIPSRIQHLEASNTITMLTLVPKM